LYAGLEAAAGLDSPTDSSSRGPAGLPAAAAADDGNSTTPANKVAAVCNAVRAAAQALDAAGGSPDHPRARLLKVVVTSYARSDPPDLESALLAMRDVKEASLAAGETPSVWVTPAAVGAGSGSEGDEDDDAFVAPQPQPSPVSNVASNAANGHAAADTRDSLGAAADGALRHLLLHVDADALYRCALGLYDLGLAFMVVCHAQKDPGEYLEELSRFGAVEVRRLPTALRFGCDGWLGEWKEGVS